MNFEHIPKSNLHTHTRFADGKHTAEEVVLSAIEKGMEVIGFSEHSYNGRNDVYGMKDEETVAAYRAEIQRLQKAYGERIRILLGIEQDSFGGLPTAPYDYVLGSVHYVYLGGEFCAVDHSRAVMEDSRQRGPFSLPPCSPKFRCSRAMAAKPSRTARTQKSRSPPLIVSSSPGYFGLPREICIPVECPWRQTITGGFSTPTGSSR